uniref:START domain-containing protein n=1 Tax=Setaria digitata TaxID=48799 RepID=A0A915PUA0_9BILA
MLKLKRWLAASDLYDSEEKMNTANEYTLHVCYQFRDGHFKKTFNKLYRCKWTAVKGFMSGTDQIASSSTSGSTESVETTGRRDELIEFVNSVSIFHNYDDDVTLRFELTVTDDRSKQVLLLVLVYLSSNNCTKTRNFLKFCAEKSMLSSTGSDSRRNSDSIVRFRNSSDLLSWNPVDSMECDLNAVVHRVISERVSVDRVFAERQVRMEVSISQLEKRGKMKYTDLETYLAIHRKSLLKNDYIIIYRSPKTMEITSTSLHKFPEIIISYDKLLGGLEDRVIYFTLRNAANGDVIGEADVSYSHLVADGKVNLKLQPRDINSNTLFGVSRRSLHPVGVLHVNVSVENNSTSCPSRSSSESRYRSSVELSSSLSSTDDRWQHSLRNCDEEESNFSRPCGKVMLASGRTQAYLVSLLAPTIEVRLRQSLIRSAEPLIDNNFYKCASSIL